MMKKMELQLWNPIELGVVASNAEVAGLLLPSSFNSKGVTRRAAEKYISVASWAELGRKGEAHAGNEGEIEPKRVLYL